MNYRFFIAHLGALCLLAGVVRADSDASADVAPQDEVVVVANRMPEPLSKVGASVTVLSAEAIEQSQAVSAADLLARTPGLSFARNGSMGSATSVFIRGAESAQTVVRIDGVLLNDPSTTGGGFDFSNLLTGGMSRIEILRGAQSTLYGSQAVGGVIDITTAEPTRPFGGGVTFEGGSHGTGYVAGDVGGRQDGLSWRVTGNYLGTSGFPSFDTAYGGARRDASQIGGGSGQVRYDLTDRLQIDLRGYFTQARTDFDGYDTPTFAFGDDSEYGRTNQTVGYAGLNWTPSDALSQRFAFQYTGSETRNYDPAVMAASTETYYGIGRNYREEYQGTWQIAPAYHAVFGAQHERSTFDTDTPAYDVAPAPLGGAVSLDSGYAQLQAEVVPGLNLTAGGRYDHHDVFGGHATGQAAAAWALADGATVLRASFGQGFKAPSLYQLYSDYGNRALRPEESNSWDAGVERHAWDGRVTYSATYFERQSRSLIDFFDCAGPATGLCSTEPYGYYANIARARARGAELQASVAPATALTVAGNYTYTGTRNESTGSANYGNQLARRPSQTANLSVDYRWPLAVSTTVAARYAGRSFDDAANQTSLGGYVLVDLRASYAVLDQLSVYARIENVGGKRYETAYQYGTPGRVAYAGVRVTF